MYTQQQIASPVSEQSLAITIKFSGHKASSNQFILKHQAFDRHNFPHHPQGDTDTTRVTQAGGCKCRSHPTPKSLAIS